MGQPILYLVSDQAPVLRALADDLARRFDRDFAIRTEKSPAAALEELADLPDEIALLIAAQRMQEMPGVEFLCRAHDLQPTARRMLLVGRRDWKPSNPAVRAMSLGQIDSYLFEPWLPLERWLYLPVSGALADWTPMRAPSFEGIRVIGPRWATRSHELRDMFTRMGIPHGWYSADSAEGRRLLAEAGADQSRLPVILFHNGWVFVDPSNAELADALGFGTRPTASDYDVAIVGAGPAGLAAAVYAASEGLRTVVVEQQVAGGQASASAQIRNYLGFPHGISGNTLTNRALEQAWLFGADLVLAQQAKRLAQRGVDRVLTLSDGSEITARTTIIATGVTWRRLGVPALEALVGAGVFYGAAGAEARAMEGQRVFVIGAGNAAGQAATHLARWAESVTMLVRGGALGETMSDYLVQQIGNAPNITVRLHTEVVDGHGRGRLERLSLRDRRNCVIEEVPAVALFVLIGAEPRTEWLAGDVERDKHGYVVTGHDLLQAGKPPPGWTLQRPPLALETSVPGVFAAGDVRYRSIKRVASAVGEGAGAVQFVHDYLSDQRSLS
jgi:thioredoxin reductase (NADPH)